MGKSAGKIMPLPRGPYDATATYNILDMVTLNNKLWVAKKSGVKGVTPSDDAAEWMMAVDGTTDVKGLETTVNEKFSAIDTKFTGYDADLNALRTQDNTTETNVRNLSTTVGNLNTSVSGLSTRCANIEGAIVPDTEATKDSNKLITSGAVYKELNYSEDKDMAANGDYEQHASYISSSQPGIGIQATVESQVTVTSNNIVHKLDNTRLNVNGTNIYLCAFRRPLQNNTDNYGSSFLTGPNGESTIDIRPGVISFRAINDGTYGFGSDEFGFDLDVNNKSAGLFPNFNSKLDLGRDMYKWRNIYASTGTIQTSDRNEKKDIDALDDITARDLIMGLHPVTYKFINNTSDRVHYGLIAQDVETLLGHLGIENQDFAGLIKSPKTDEDGNPIEGEYRYGLRYDEFIAPLIKMCQNLQNEVTELRAEIETLKNK